VSAGYPGRGGSPKLDKLPPACQGRNKKAARR
jgi:hypothetical protein